MSDDARGGGAAGGAGGSDPGLPAAAALPPAPPPAAVGVRVGGGVKPVGARTDVVAGEGGGATGTPDTSDEVIVLCPSADCEVGLPGGVGSTIGLTHLSKHHLFREVPAATVAEHRLVGCRWCCRPFWSVRGRTGWSSLTAHEAQCPRKPRKRFAREAAPAAARGRTAVVSAGGGSAWASVRGATAGVSVPGVSSAAGFSPAGGVAAASPAAGG